MDAQLKHGDLFAFDRTDLNLVGVIHERFRDRLATLGLLRRYERLGLGAIALVASIASFGQVSFSCGRDNGRKKEGTTSPRRATRCPRVRAL